MSKDLRELLPWQDIMAFGLGFLRLSPNAFWCMTPRELDAAIAGALGKNEGRSPLIRDELSNLMQTYPDANLKENLDE